MKLYIYYVKAHPHWPVGEAGAVVIAANKENAVRVSKSEDYDLLKAEPPVLIGTAAKGEKERIVFINDGNY